jgi:undecaprenyl-diphosphatase
VKRFFSFINNGSIPRILLIEINTGIVVNIVILFLFFVLTYEVLEKKTLLFDTNLANIIYSFRTPLITIIMETTTEITNTAAGLVLSITVATLLLFKRHKKESLIFSLSLITGCILNYLLKIFFKISRPDIAPLEVSSDFSYPSGHAMNNLVLYGLIAFYTFHFTKKKLLGLTIGFIAAAWIALIGLSRVYLGAHYPSDVIGGYLVGFWWLLTVLSCASRIPHASVGGDEMK